MTLMPVAMMMVIKSLGRKRQLVCGSMMVGGSPELCWGVSGHARKTSLAQEQLVSVIAFEASIERKLALWQF